MVGKPYSSAVAVVPPANNNRPSAASGVPAAPERGVAGEPVAMKAEFQAWYSSADAELPPTIRTAALWGKRNAEWLLRAESMLAAVAANPGVRAEEEYSSAEARSRDPSEPPATSTSPFSSVVAECPMRAVERLGPLDTFAVAGSKISVEFRIWLPSNPPTIITRPPDNNTAAWFLRGMVSVPAKEKEPVAGLKISSVLPGAPEPSPPAIRTRPSARSVAVWPEREANIESPMVQERVAGL